MADDGGRDDKTELPTEKKLSEAIEQGNLPVSREAPLFAFLAASLLLCTLMLRDNAARLIGVLARLMDNPGGWALRNGADAANLGGAVAGAVATFVVPVFIVFILAGLAVSFAQNMPRVVLSRIAPKLSKLSPMGGLKRLLGRQGLIEFGKALFKIAVTLAIVAFVMNAQRDAVIDAIFVDPTGIPETILSLFVRLLSGVATAFVLLVAADLLLTRIAWNKSMMMSRQEVKDEFRQAEGDPMLKAKRRSLALDRARRRMMGNVPRATLVIANPTHFAIALRYVRDETAAPVVVAKGQDLVALRIREIAEQNGIAVVEDKLLARSMYDHVEVEQAIPPQFYKAVAEIIHFIMAKNNKTTSLERSRVMR